MIHNVSLLIKYVIGTNTVYWTYWGLFCRICVLLAVFSTVLNIYRYVHVKQNGWVYLCVCSITPLIYDTSNFIWYIYFVPNHSVSFALFTFISNALCIYVPLNLSQRCIKSELRPSWSEPSSVPEFLVTRLETFEWDEYEGKEEEKEVVEFILKNGFCLKKVIIKPIPTSRKKLEMSTELAFLPRSSPACRNIYDWSYRLSSGDKSCSIVRGTSPNIHYLMNFHYHSNFIFYDKYCLI